MAIRLATLSYDQEKKTGHVRLIRSFHVDSADEIESVIEPSVMGYFATGEIRATNWDPQDVSQGFQVDVSYEGAAKDVTTGIDDALWQFRPQFEKEPIEKHPHIDYLIENYGGQEDPETKRITFVRKLSRTTTSQVGSALYAGLHVTETNTTERDNPLYGLQESGWLSMSGIATAKFLTDDPAQLGGVGQIIDELPGNAPDYGIDEDRNWLKAPPLIDEIAQPAGEQRLHSVELQFLLSPKGGWPPAVYRFIDV